MARLFCFDHDRRTAECRKKGERVKRCVKSKPRWWASGQRFSEEKEQFVKNKEAWMRR